MRCTQQFLTFACLVAFSPYATAAGISGKVLNGTTGKPAAGDPVVLLSLANGMTESARATTNAQGEFALEIPDPGTQHLVRVTHQEVNYFVSLAPGSTSADVKVYDAARKIDPLVGVGRVIRMQTVGDTLEVSEAYILRNESNPPRTWMDEHTFAITLPEGANLQQGMAAGPNGMPVNSTPIPLGKPGRYAFAFPLRPGESQLQVTYRLPYTGSHPFTITPDMPLAELGVMLPKTMRFDSTGEAFATAADEAGMAVFVAKSIAAGTTLRFTVAGQGTAPQNQPSARDSGVTPGQAAAGSSAPAGGDDSKSLLWFVTISAMIALAGGAYWVYTRRPATAVPPTARGSARGSSVVEAIKDEIFRLETDRIEGKISEKEYSATRSGFDTLVRRHLQPSDESRKK